ncbi:shieldin complex subunit 1 isoform X1 [Apteryx rowi]|uniref:shieldin complex subunit 1 isoform X1 n=1 Tax=Apteryx rowi TaxID=308060 RepID=UPI000E1CA612|nr:shieldin complex subunit 1 isoform X1 [Apteryx rowi]XP_025936493.1 shieldin complex subunit 1 isoform X1 [Apteryx rowi]XP_025936494.1 shieldin complex subunit 1 isoform X1 [Apteryx rowi]XP_025936495.1 shieldin complex subunit 1 isoform X1 [Apteryx rowi]XP_025936496.1 shieldin complex subunit 1 isoform X1 [Apteryx rowi]
MRVCGVPSHCLTTGSGFSVLSFFTKIAQGYSWCCRTQSPLCLLHASRQNRQRKKLAQDLLESRQGLGTEFTLHKNNSCGTMEGRETSPSPHSEESSMLDLPSACDLAENFLPPRSMENSEELCFSVDTLLSLPTVSQAYLLNEAGISDWLTQPSVLWAAVIFLRTPLRIPGENGPPSAVPGGCSAEGTEKASVSYNPKAGLCERTEPGNAALSWMYEHDSTEDTSVRKSLDSFYEKYCETQLGRRDPTCEAGSRCLSQKISELSNQEGTKYALRCLQMAQVVLNRDGCKIFPNHPTTACFAKPAEEEVVLEEKTRTPGLSDDVLQLLLKQTQTGHSP